MIVNAVTTARYVCDPLTIEHGRDTNIVERITGVVLDHVASQIGPDEDARASWFAECWVGGPEGLMVHTTSWDPAQPLPTTARQVICQGWSWAPRAPGS